MELRIKNRDSGQLGNYTDEVGEFKPPSGKAGKLGSRHATHLRAEHQTGMEVMLGGVRTGDKFDPGRNRLGGDTVSKVSNLNPYY